MTGCSYCGAEPTQPFSRDFDFRVCRACGIRQQEALERIAQMVRPLKWAAPADLSDEPVGPDLPSRPWPDAADDDEEARP